MIPGEAEGLFRQALAYRQAKLRADHPKIAEAQCLLGQALVMQGRYAEAEPLLRQGYPVFKTWGMAEANVVAEVHQVLVETRMALDSPN